MKCHRRTVRRLAIGLVAIGALIPVSAASALQDPGSSPSANNAAAKVGDTPADFPGAGRAPGVALDSAAKVGDTPADFPGAGRAPGVALDSAAKVGDTPADFPGASGAPAIAPPTIQVIRRERIVVRDVNEVLPIALSGAALFIVLMGAAFVLVRMRLERRHAVGRSH
jgi:hypothetical protein